MEHQIETHSDADAKPTPGHYYRHQDGDLYIAYEDDSAVTLISLIDGRDWAGKNGFNGCADHFTRINYSFTVTPNNE